MTTQLPGPETRWRCGHCGNLTRFDVTRTRSTKEYWHFSMSGEPEVEQVDVTAEEIITVVCRWCGAADALELVPRPDRPEDVLNADGAGGTP